MVLDQPLIGWYLDDDGHETVRPRILDSNMSISTGCSADGFCGWYLFL
jgi:hypothetical protein